jgi:hypothetical protein
MRERDMRARIERFIQSRLRSMLMPATLGLGMALAGCDGDGLEVNDGGDPIVKNDAADKQDAGATMKYIAPIPDAAPDLSGPAPEYIAPIPDAGPDLSGLQPDYMAPNPRPDSGVAVRYMAQMPDADPGTVVALYIAQMP